MVCISDNIILSLSLYLSLSFSSAWGIQGISKPIAPRKRKVSLLDSDDEETEATRKRRNDGKQHLINASTNKLYYTTTLYLVYVVLNIYTILYNNLLYYIILYIQASDHGSRLLRLPNPKRQKGEPMKLSFPWLHPRAEGAAAGTAAARAAATARRAAAAAARAAPARLATSSRELTSHCQTPMSLSLMW